MVRGPLGQLVEEQRHRLSLSLAELPKRVNVAAAGEGIAASYGKSAAIGWTRWAIPQPATLRWLAGALELPLAQLRASAEAQEELITKLAARGLPRRLLSRGVAQGALAILDASGHDRRSHVLTSEAGQSPLAGWPPTEPADHDYVDSMHVAVQHLVGLDNAYGGNEIAALATRTFRRAQSHLEIGSYVPAIERDLQAGAAELAEVAGWLLHDAGNEPASRQLNQEALLLARLAGDRSMEHLTLANMSFQALFQRHPGEALQIARTELTSGPLPPRLRVIFRVREARALAQLGDESATRQSLAAAMSVFLDGPSRIDPAWAWWMDSCELVAHHGGALRDLGDMAGALALLQQALEECPPHRRSARFIYTAQFLRALIDAHAWQDAEAVIQQAANLAGEVGSARTHGLLQDAVSRIARADAPAAVREAAQRLTVDC